MKTPFVTKEKIQEITKQIPTPFNIYDEKGIRENARAVWNDWSGMVVNNLVLHILFVFTVIDPLEDEDFSILMERVSCYCNNDCNVCNKLVVS